MQERNYRVLSGSMLKVIATISMFVDHTAFILMSRKTTPLFRIADIDVSVYYIMRAVGRLAFPIFVFLLVEGFIHTSSRKRYAIRLFVFALIAEVPWNLEHAGILFYPASQSVFVTLFFDLLGLCALEHLQNDKENRVKWAGALVGVFVALALARSDYGAKSLAVVLTIYLLRQQPVAQAVVSSSALGDPLFCSLAFIPINMYNGERGFIKGRVLQLLFYAIYPVHMYILYRLRIQMYGY